LQVCADVDGVFVDLAILHFGGHPKQPNCGDGGEKIVRSPGKKLKGNQLHANEIRRQINGSKHPETSLQ
jgi:hypothetical protein